jgi:ribosomal protein S12 methylthiotransferase
MNENKVGQTLKVIIDKKEGEYFIGRTEFDSPEVDNEVFLDASSSYVRIGDFTDVEITGASEYDLHGKAQTT